MSGVLGQIAKNVMITMRLNRGQGIVTIPQPNMEETIAVDNRFQPGAVLKVIIPFNKLVYFIHRWVLRMGQEKLTIALN